MSRRRLVLVALLAAAVGAGAGLLLRPRANIADARPQAVEAVLRAVDHDDLPALARATTAAGPAEGYSLPWREEVELGRAVLAGDEGGLWRFATGGPPSAARARALLWLRSRAATVAEWKRLEARLKADYPASWALSAGAGKGAGR